MYCFLFNATVSLYIREMTVVFKHTNLSNTMTSFDSEKFTFDVENLPQTQTYTVHQVQPLC